MDREELIQELVESLTKLRKVTHQAAWQVTNLPRGQTGFLFMLFHHAHSSVNEIAHFLGITKSAVTQLADPLVNQGLVSREKDARDRRIVRLSLTSKGQTALKLQKQHMLEGLRAAVGNLDDKELSQLVTLHRKIINKS